MTFTYDDNTVFDLYKDAHGFRPSSDWMAHWEKAIPEEKQVLWDELMHDLDCSIKAEIEAEERAFADFEERIIMLMKAGAVDKATATRWLAESVDALRDDGTIDAGYFCFRLGLPYSMENEFK